MNWWKKLRRWLGFPGFDYAVDADDRVLTMYLSVMNLTVRQEVVDWCNKYFAANQWRVEFYETDTNPDAVRFKFRHKKHAAHFKLVWGK